MVGAQLELRVGQDDPGAGASLRGEPVEGDRDPLRLRQHVRAHDLGGLVAGDVLVVAFLRLGRRREDRPRQGLGLAEPGREPVPTHRTGVAVVAPPAAGEVAAHHALDGQHLEPPHHHRAPGEVGVADLGRHVREPGRQEVVRHDPLRLAEPVGGQPGEHAALVWDLRRHHHVVRADAIARDHEQSVVAKVVDITDLPWTTSCTVGL